MKGKFEEIRDTSTLLVLRNLKMKLQLSLLSLRHIPVFSVSSLISQKGKSQNGCFKETKEAKPNFPKNEHFLPPDTYTYMCVLWGKECLFFRKFEVLCFLETPVLKLALLAYYRRYRHCEIA